MSELRERGGRRELRDRHEVAEYALLGLLRGGPAHGYRLAAAFAPNGWLHPILRLKMSQMYAYLHKLERQGWLEAEEETPTTAGTMRSRRIFTLTDAGERAFDDWTARPVSATRDVRVDFLVKLAFAIERDSDAALDLVDHQRGATIAWLDHLHTQAHESKATSDKLDLRRLTLDHRLRQTTATLAWLDDLRGALTSISLPDPIAPSSK